MEPGRAVRGQRTARRCRGNAPRTRASAAFRCRATATTSPTSWLPCAGTKPPYAASPTSTMRPTSMWKTSSSSRRPNGPGCSPRAGEAAFLEYLRDQFAPDRGAGAADRLLASATRPSKQLMKLAASEIKDREQFVLLDEQRLAYEIVLHAVGKARRSDAKEVVIITGGPGSGKSVIALSLLGELCRQGYSACTRPAPGPLPRRCGGSGPRLPSRQGTYSSTSTASWTPSKMTLKC